MKFGSGKRGRQSATKLMNRGSELLDTDLDAAERLYREALELDDSLSGAWFDLGLICKWRHQWEPCLEYNLKASALNGSEPGTQDPAFWNAGIAATALHNWVVARFAWTSYGIPISDGDGPIEQNFGAGVVRLPHGETLWGQRLDPARMKLTSVPLPDSGFRCGDVVLHDGSPEGSRVVDGHEFSVFNVLERFEACATPTTEVLVDASGAAVETLIQAIVDIDGATAENWSTSIAVHCSACSNGRVDYDHPDHDHPQKPNSGGYTRVGCSADPDELALVLTNWDSSTDGVVQSTTTHH